MARQTKERAEQTRESIIDAGVDAFFRRGVARASLEEVARSCGVTRGAIYWHFASKHELFIAVEDRLREPQRAELETLLGIARGDDALAALQEVILRLLGDLAANEAMRRVMTVVLLRIDCSPEAEPSLARQAEHQAYFREGLQRYFRDHVPPAGTQSVWTADTASETVFALVQGTILRTLRFPDQYPLQTVGIPIIATFMDALRRNWLA